MKNTYKWFKVSVLCSVFIGISLFSFSGCNSPEESHSVSDSETSVSDSVNDSDTGIIDTIKPAAITDLRIETIDGYSAVLTWTSPGDDIDSGNAATYDIRYSGVNITDGAGFDSAAIFSNSISPKEAGLTERCVVTGLSLDTVYYFAIKTSDEASNTSSISNVPSGRTSAVHCPETYAIDTGDGFAAVGNSEDRNSYRGVFWTGETKSICSADVYLRVTGDISGINYKVTVWEVDVTDDLSLSRLLATSEIVSGGDIADSEWTRFNFSSEVQIVTGKTSVLISRDDVSTLDGGNFVNVGQNYDTSDNESRQWNIHYYDNGVMAGRGNGDENQPEYFACLIKFQGYNTVVASTLEYPNLPEDVIASAQSPDTIRVSWVERGVNNVIIDHYNIYEYNTVNGNTDLIGHSKVTSFDHKGLDSGSTHTYVVTAVSKDGNESYHSLDNEGRWQATTP